MFPIIALFVLYALLIIFVLTVMLAMIYAIFPTIIFFGGPYVVTREEYSSKMVDLACPKKEEKMLDLGSGDGRIVIDFAQAGALAYGYEINPYLVFIAKQKIAKYGLSKNAFISCKNFWREDLSGFDIITVYPAGFMMEKLEKKMEKELRSGAKVVLNGFKFPNWKIKASEGQIYLYEKE
jgi:SAM-dependent methyltransferase